MIGFLCASLQLHLVTITYNSSQSVIVLDSFRFLLDYERLPFHYGWLDNFLATEQFTLSLTGSLSDL
jgi:hypothetical protein